MTALIMHGGTAHTGLVITMHIVILMTHGGAGVLVIIAKLKASLLLMLPAALKLTAGDLQIHMASR